MAERFWADARLEPKRQHRWLLNIDGIDAFLIKTAQKPSFTVDETPHNFFGHKFYYPGTVTWNTIEVTLVDPIDPDTSTILYHKLRMSGYEIPDRLLNEPLRPGLFTPSKAEATDALGQIVKLRQIGQIDDVPNQVVEEWKLYNPWITAVNFGNLDYASADMVEISLTIRFDFAQVIAKPGSPG
jgi:hypothetical protein|tara:strand:+ start:2706 stop:3257 length:552 start_codon:yes stop_codon:yes gene_type:complete